MGYWSGDQCVCKSAGGKSVFIHSMERGGRRWDLQKHHRHQHQEELNSRHPDYLSRFIIHFFSRTLKRGKQDEMKRRRQEDTPHITSCTPGFQICRISIPSSLSILFTLQSSNHSTYIKQPTDCPSTVNWKGYVSTNHICNQETP